MKKNFLVFSVLSFALILSGGICMAQGQGGPSGIHEPGTGLENPELKEKNQGTGLGLEEMNASGTQTQKQVQEQANVQLHQNIMDTFVQNLLQVANRENGIGAQIRTIAQEQNQSASTTVQAMEKIQTRSQFKTFLIGNDYKNLGELRSEMVKTQNRLQQLNQIMENTNNASDKTQLQDQVQTLEQEQTKIESFVKEQDSKFSLFGWFVRMFNK